jgi:hypothetical protein
MTDGVFARNNEPSIESFPRHEYQIGNMNIDKNKERRL